MLTMARQAAPKTIKGDNMTDIITTTVTITMAMVLNMQECHCDGMCGIGPSGEQGPYQILSFGQMEKLGYPKDGSVWYMDFYMARPAVQEFINWLDDTQPCSDPRWTYAAWNWGIGNVLRHVEQYGCDLDTLPPYVYSFANMERGLMCYETRRDEWSPMIVDDVYRRMWDEPDRGISTIHRGTSVPHRKNALHR